MAVGESPLLEGQVQGRDGTTRRQRTGDVLPVRVCLHGLSCHVPVTAYRAASVFCILATRSSICRCISSCGNHTRWPWPGSTHSNEKPANLRMDSICRRHEYQQ